MKKKYIRLKDRPTLDGFDVVNIQTSRRITPNPEWSNHGIVCNEQAGFFMGQNGSLYALDCYDRLFEVYPSDKVEIKVG